MGQFCIRGIDVINFSISAKDTKVDNFVSVALEKRPLALKRRVNYIAIQIIKELKIKKMILVSRAKKRVIALKGYGIEIKKQEIIK